MSTMREGKKIGMNGDWGSEWLGIRRLTGMEALE